MAKAYNNNDMYKKMFQKFGCYLCQKPANVTDYWVGDVHGVCYDEKLKREQSEFCVLCGNNPSGVKLGDVCISCDNNPNKQHKNYPGPE